MSDQTNNMPNSSVSEQSEEVCFGGFSEKFSYERCKRNNSISAGGKLLRVGVSLIAVGVFLSLSGIAMYHVVNSNKTLYYPEIDGGTDSTAKQAETYKVRREAVETHVSEGYFANITPDIAGRYNLPQGVVVRDAESVSGYFGAELMEEDIIVSLGNDDVGDAASLYALITENDYRSDKTIEVFRNGKRIVINPSPIS